MQAKHMQFEYFSEVLNYKLNGFFNTSSNGHTKKKAIRKQNSCSRKFKLHVRVTLKLKAIATVLSTLKSRLIC